MNCPPPAAPPPLPITLSVPASSGVVVNPPATFQVPTSASVAEFSITTSPTAGEVTLSAAASGGSGATLTVPIYAGQIALVLTLADGSPLTTLQTGQMATGTIFFEDACSFKWCAGYVHFQHKPKCHCNRLPTGGRAGTAGDRHSFRHLDPIHPDSRRVRRRWRVQHKCGL